MRAVVAERPAEEFAVAHRCNVIRNESIADLVALVRCGPKFMARWIPRKSVRTADAGSKDARQPVCQIDFQDRGAILFGVESVLAYIAVRADGGVQLFAVRTRDDVFRPV